MPRRSGVTRKISEIRPSPENDEVYGRFNPDHPDDCALIDIHKRGVMEPLIVTLDGYIVSGHRRYAACQHLHALAWPDQRTTVLGADCVELYNQPSGGNQADFRIHRLYRPQTFRLWPREM